MGGLPAAEKKYTIEEFKEMLLSYKDIDNDELKNNFSEFLKEIIPVAEENNIKMALHPDDPPISLFGLPRIVSNHEDYQFVLDQYKSHNNGITFCTGSLASNFNNDIYKMFDYFNRWYYISATDALRSSKKNRNMNDTIIGNTSAKR